MGHILGPPARKGFIEGYQGDTRALGGQLAPAPLYRRIFNQTETFQSNGGGIFSHARETLIRSTHTKLLQVVFSLK